MPSNILASLLGRLTKAAPETAPGEATKNALATHLDPKFVENMGEAFVPCAYLILNIYESLDGDRATNSDPELAKALQWSREVVQSYNDDTLIFSDEMIDNLLHYAPYAILASVKNLTADVARNIVMDPFIEQWALDLLGENPIAEEVNFIKRKQGITTGNMASGLGVPAENLEKTRSWKATYPVLSASKRGNAREGQLFVDVVALFLRSLRRFIKASKTLEGKTRFEVQPPELGKSVIAWAEARIEWSKQNGIRSGKDASDL